MILLHTCWGVITFTALDEAKWFHLAFVWLAHLTVSCLVLAFSKSMWIAEALKIFYTLNSESSKCQISICCNCSTSIHHPRYFSNSCSQSNLCYNSIFISGIFNELKLFWPDYRGISGGTQELSSWSGKASKCSTWKWVIGRLKFLNPITITNVKK